MSSLTITLIGGPTALIEIDGFRLLTDPTFDAPGAYPMPHVTLEKLSGPALSAEAIGKVDAVLLSHDQHADNLDHSGKDFLTQAKRVLTTVAGATRLGHHAEGLAPWATTELTGKGGRTLTVTATPARHGPAGIEPLSGDVIGFVLTSAQPSDLHQRRYGLVRWRGRSRAAISSRRGAAVRRRGADPRPVPSHHGHQRHHRDRAGISGCRDRAAAQRRMGAFPPKQRRPARVL